MIRRNACEGWESRRIARWASSPAASRLRSLTLALAKRPGLLVLDEPVASLDPLARRDFMRTLVDAVAEREVAVLLSSHGVAELERVCDHLVLLDRAGCCSPGTSTICLRGIAF